MAIVRPDAGPLGWRDPEWQNPAGSPPPDPVAYYGPEHIPHYGPPAPESKPKSKPKQAKKPVAAPATGNRAAPASPDAPPPAEPERAFPTLGQMLLIAGITKALKVW